MCTDTWQITLDVPLPKAPQRQETNITPNNYATALDNLKRPNTSFAQAVTKSTNNSRNPQQMAAPSNTRRNLLYSLRNEPIKL
ncbi:hypothetical protein TNCV_3278261 [Trichonephila clavipes]|nr:hypothetical protein TNCV_3278261 [Trichonephila clavipes]